jgi:hypothetical protein
MQWRSSTVDALDETAIERNVAEVAGQGRFRNEGARGTLHESLRANEIAELRHRDASKRERRRVVAQGDRFNAPEGITPPRAHAPRP